MMLKEKKVNEKWARCFSFELPTPDKNDGWVSKLHFSAIKCRENYCRSNASSAGRDQATQVEAFISELIILSLAAPGDVITTISALRATLETHQSFMNIFYKTLSLVFYIVIDVAFE